MIEGLEHGHPGALADHQTVPVGRKRPAGLAGKRPQRIPALEHAVAERRIRPAGKHHIGAAEPQLIGGRRDGVIGRGAGRGDAEHRAAQAEHHDYLAGGRAGHHPRHREDAGPRLVLDQQSPIVLLEGLGPVDAGADHGADPQPVRRSVRQLRLSGTPRRPRSPPAG